MSMAFSDSSANWERHVPASERSIQALTSNCAYQLPEEYLEFLMYSNGGEGELAIEPGWFQVWPAEEVLHHNHDYHMTEFAPGFFAFGSNGGGEMLAFDTRQVPTWKVVMLPFIGMDESEAVVIAEDFTSFARAMGREAA